MSSVGPVDSINLRLGDFAVIEAQSGSHAALDGSAICDVALMERHKRTTLKYATAFYRQHNCLKIAEIGYWIAIEYDHVGELSRLDAAHPTLLACLEQ